MKWLNDIIDKEIKQTGKLPLWIELTFKSIIIGICCVLGYGLLILIHIIFGF